MLARQALFPGTMGICNRDKAAVVRHAGRIPAFPGCTRHGQPRDGVPDILPGGLRMDGAHAQHLFAAQFGGENLCKSTLGYLPGNRLIERIPS